MQQHFSHWAKENHKKLISNNFDWTSGIEGMGQNGHDYMNKIAYEKHPHEKWDFHEDIYDEWLNVYLSGASREECDKVFCRIWTRKNN